MNRETSVVWDDVSHHLTKISIDYDATSKYPYPLATVTLIAVQVVASDGP